MLPTLLFLYANLIIIITNNIAPHLGHRFFCWKITLDIRVGKTFFSVKVKDLQSIAFDSYVSITNFVHLRPQLVSHNI